MIFMNGTSIPSLKRDSLRAVTIRPVIELAVKNLILPRGSRSEDLVSRIEKAAADKKYQGYAAGWVVPLSDLTGNLPGLAEYLYMQAVFAGVFEIAGGLDIYTGTGESLDIPRGASFRLAMGLARTMIDLEEGEEPRQAYVARHEPWVLTLKDGNVDLKARGQILKLPEQPVKEQAQKAIDEIRQIAGRIEPLMLSFRDQWITSEVIRSGFGLFA